MPGISTRRLQVHLTHKWREPFPNAQSIPAKKCLQCKTFIYPTCTFGCVQTDVHAHESVRISAAKPKPFYFKCGVLLNFMPSPKNPRILFRWLSRFCFTKAVAKEQNFLLIHIDASLMQIRCSCAPTPCSRDTGSYPKAYVCSYTLERAGPDSLHYWAREKDGLQNEAPSGTASPPLGWRNPRSSRTTRAWHWYFRVELSSPLGAA